MSFKSKTYEVIFLYQLPEAETAAQHSAQQPVKLLFGRYLKK